MLQLLEAGPNLQWPSDNHFTISSPLTSPSWPCPGPLSSSSCSPLTALSLHCFLKHWVCRLFQFPSGLTVTPRSRALLFTHFLPPEMHILLQALRDTGEQNRQVSASRSGKRMITGNKLVSGSDEGHETNTWDRMDEASTSDRAVTEGFSEPPFMLRFRWWGSSHRNIWEKGLSQGKGAWPRELASSVWKSGGYLWPKYSQEENKLEWKRRAGPTHVKSSQSMEGSTGFVSANRKLLEFYKRTRDLTGLHSDCSQHLLASETFTHMTPLGPCFLVLLKLLDNTAYPWLPPFHVHLPLHPLPSACHHRDWNCFLKRPHMSSCLQSLFSLHLIADPSWSSSSSTSHFLTEGSSWTRLVLLSHCCPVSGEAPPSTLTHRADSSGLSDFLLW